MISPSTANAMRVLSARRHRAVLDAIAGGATTIDAIVAQVGTHYTTVYASVGALVDAGWVELPGPAGASVASRLPDARVRLAERLAEMVAEVSHESAP